MARCPRSNQGDGRVCAAIQRKLTSNDEPQVFSETILTLTGSLRGAKHCPADLSFLVLVQQNDAHTALFWGRKIIEQVRTRWRCDGWRGELSGFTGWFQGGAECPLHQLRTMDLHRRQWPQFAGQFVGLQR